MSGARVDGAEGDGGAALDEDRTLVGAGPGDGGPAGVAVAHEPHPRAVDGVREVLRDTLPGYALPRRLLLVDAMPLRGPGKPDRVALAASDQWQNWATSPDAAT